MTTFPALALLALLLAPLPPGVAVNYLTNECAGYWGGDEYVAYVVPSGWAYYLPDENNEIRTLQGTHAWTGSAEEFCNEIAFRYVSDNIAKDRGERLDITPEVSYQTQASEREAEAAQRSQAEVVLAIGMLLVGAALGCGLCLLIRRR